MISKLFKKITRKDQKKIVLIILLFILVIVLSLTLYKKLNIFNKNRVNDIIIHQTKNKNPTFFKCKKNILKPERYVIDKYNLEYSENNDWDLYIPCGYNNINEKINNIRPINAKQKIYVIYGCDKIVSKNNLWNILLNYYGRTDEQIMPNTYNLTKEEEINLFLEEFNSKKLYIMKKNIQRKEGILLIKDKDTVINNINNNYKIVQEYIKDLYLINERKINLRYYFLVITKNNEVNTFLYKFGKCIYSNKQHKYSNNNTDLSEEELNNSNNRENFITSYNLDPKIYNVLPETFEELKQFMGHNKYNILQNNINNLFKKLSNAIVPEFKHNNHLSNNLCFQLFGADILFNNNLKPYLLELNKGPSMKYITEKDKMMKQQLKEDLFLKMKIIKNKNKNKNLKNNFKRLI